MEFKNYVNIYEPLLNGEFGDTEPHEYLLEADHKMTNEEFKDIIFQACEIERFSNGNLCVDITIEKNDEFYNHEEIFIKINIVRTNELSEYIVWDKCPNLPPIYKVDREKSTIEVLDD